MFNRFTTSLKGHCSIPSGSYQLCSCIAHGKYDSTAATMSTGVLLVLAVRVWYVCHSCKNHPHHLPSAHCHSTTSATGLPKCWKPFLLRTVISLTKSRYRLTPCCCSPLLLPDEPFPSHLQLTTTPRRSLLKLQNVKRYLLWSQ